MMPWLREPFHLSDEDILLVARWRGIAKTVRGKSTHT